MSPLLPTQLRVLGRRRHGVVTALPIARDSEVVAANVAGSVDEAKALLALIHPDEAALATTWGILRVRTFVAGRLALRAALREVGVDVSGPILRDARGAPMLPNGVRASVSHKDDLAVALAELDVDDDGAKIGVDVELARPPPGEGRGAKSDISRHVLTDAELAELAELDALGLDVARDPVGRAPALAARETQLLIRFSLKEALYKALDPFVHRFVGFREVEVTPAPSGDATFTLSLAQGEGPFDVDAAWSLDDAAAGAVLTSVRVRRR